MGGRERRATRHGVFIHRIDYPPPPKPHLESAAVCQFNSLLLERLPEVAGECGAFDVVCSHDWLTALAGHGCSPLCEAIHAWTVHDLVVGKRDGELTNEDKFTANVERWAASVADIIICNSVSVCENLVSTYGADQSRTVAVPCAVSADTFTTQTPDSHMPFFRRALAMPDETVVLYVGRLDTEKGLDVLMNAAVRVLREHPSTVFVLAGKGELEKAIRRDTSQGPLRGRVKILGYVPSHMLAHLYRIADMQVVPSRYEPFGIVALEGMVNGLPVVAANVGGLGSIVDDGVDGLTFPTEGHDELATSILRLARDTSLRERLGEAGRAKALEKYSWRVVASEILECYGAASGRVAAGRPGEAP